jgi:cysteine desulfurase/selenocysteine lyase
MDIDEIRSREFPVTENLIYLHHAGISPLPVRSARRGEAQIRKAVEYGGHNPQAFGEIAQEARAAFASLIGAEEDEIAFVKCTSEGLSFVAAGLPWRPGDNVVTASCEFPSNLYPWLGLERRGVEVRMVDPEEGRLPPGKIMAAADSKTRLVALSSVQFVTGFRADLDRIGEQCRSRGILLCVDAIQSLGVIPMSVRDTPVDFLAANGHKWLMASEGLGCLYVSKRVMDRLEPVELGWFSVRSRFDFETIDFTLDPTARRFEPSPHSHIGLAILAESLHLLQETGIESIRRRVFGLVDHLAGRLDSSWKVLSPMDEKERSGIFTFCVPGCDSKALVKKLLDRGVVTAPRGGGIRVSPHFYNTPGDMDAFLERLRDCLAGR